MKHKIITLFTAALTISPAYAGNFDPGAFIAAHNKWRAKVGVTEKLGYSQQLAVSSQAWADNLKQTNQCQMRHSMPDGKYGENIFWASALTWSDGRKELQKVSPGQVVDSWSSEKADYNYATNSCTPGKMCGHYTQVVWRTTRTVGCAMAICEDTRQQVWVCQYSLLETG
jgi:pathogenesis-related protein 1